MNLLIFGATGPTGVQLVQQALEHGHSVTAFARNPDAVMSKHERLTVVKGDILDASSVDAAVAGKDAVLSALGVRKLGKNTILSEGTKNILVAMQKHGVRRFICETSLGVGDSKGELGFLFTWVFLPLFLKNAFADKEIQEQYIRDLGTDWVIVRPTYLTNGPRRGVYQVWTGSRPAGTKGRISRADVADFMLKQVTDDGYLRKTPGLSY